MFNYALFNLCCGTYTCIGYMVFSLKYNCNVPMNYEYSSQKTLKGHVTFKVQPHASSGLFAQQHMNNNHKKVFSLVDVVM